MVACYLWIASSFKWIIACMLTLSDSLWAGYKECFNGPIGSEKIVAQLFFRELVLLWLKQCVFIVKMSLPLSNRHNSNAAHSIHDASCLYRCCYWVKTLTPLSGGREPQSMNQADRDACWSQLSGGDRRPTESVMSPSERWDRRPSGHRNQRC